MCFPLNGVARVPCALGQKYFCAPTNKTVEFEVKIVANENLKLQLAKL